MIDTDKYEGHAEGPWKIESYNQGQAFTGIKFNMTHREQTHLAMKMYGREKEREATANLIADAPLLLAEVKRLRERLMLAESALGEVRACHEDGQGNLGEILEHYRDKEGVEMSNAFDEVIE